MQILKDDIRSVILDCSRIEFRQKGFRKANIRKIASESGVSIGNIYNYFPNKDAIFRELVSLTIDAIDEAFDVYDRLNIKDEQLWSFEWHMNKYVEGLVSFLDSHRDNLNLLLFKSQGSELEGFREDFTERYTTISLRSNRHLEEVFPDGFKHVSDFFIHTVSSLNVNVIIELLMHDLSSEEMLAYLKEFMTFMFYGWERFYDRKKMFSQSAEAEKA